LRARQRLRLPHLGATLAIILSGLLMPLRARAAEPPTRLKSLTVSVWLEYDRPGALYIFRGELPDGTTLPVTLVFRIPGRSGGPSSTAGIDSSGNYHYVRPTLSDDGDTIIVEYQTNWPAFQFEYYDDALERQGQHRQLEFSYHAEYATDQLALEIKEPYGATNVALDPPGDAQSQGEDGLKVHRRNVGPVAPGQNVVWKVSYDKSDPRLSAEALGIPTPGTSPYEDASAASQPVTRTQDRVVFAVLAVLGLLALGGLLYALRSGSALPAPSAHTAGAQPAKKSRRPKGVPEPPRVRPARYCHQCGAPMSRDDIYCRKCGTRRRGA
jgi:hypothetical protein